MSYLAGDSFFKKTGSIGKALKKCKFELIDEKNKIISKEISCYQIAEDNDFIAFLDINPNSIGHTLCVPKIETTAGFAISATLIKASLNEPPISVEIIVKIKSVFLPIFI